MVGKVGAKNHIYYWHVAVGRTFCVALNHRQFELSVTLHPQHKVRKKCPTCEHSLLSICEQKSGWFSERDGYLSVHFFCSLSGSRRYFSMQVVKVSHQEKTVL